MADWSDELILAAFRERLEDDKFDNQENKKKYLKRNKNKIKTN